MSTEDRSTWPRIGAEDIHTFIVRCMKKIETPETKSRDLADLLVDADERGHYSHGLNRLDYYVDAILCGGTDKESTPVIIQENTSTAWVDGRNSLGPTVGKFCMRLAIEKAKETGVALVSVKGSNHYGTAGYYSNMAANEGMIGMSFTNATPNVVATRGKQRVLGTNPIAFSAPSDSKGVGFSLDMATSTVAMGKVEMCYRRGESIPNGWGCDKDGKETNNPKELMENQGSLLPLGGGEETGGYKGYGLSMMVEALTGILSGSNYGKNVPTWQDKRIVANLGQSFIAIDVTNFSPDFGRRMADFTDTCRASERSSSDQEILVAGDRAKQSVEDVALNGIPYHPSQIEYMEKMAKRLSVEIPEITKKI